MHLVSLVISIYFLSQHPCFVVGLSLKKKLSATALDQGWLSVRDAGYKGLGLYANCFIPAGVTIGYYEGELLTAKQYMKRYPKGDSVYTFQLNDGQRRSLLYLDAVDPAKSNFTRYINHDRSHPNLEVSIEKLAFIENLYIKSKFKYEVAFTSLKSIAKDEELTFDYGDKYPL